MRILLCMLCVLAAPSGYSAEADDRSLAFSLGGFSGSDTSGIAVGLYSLRPKRVGWYVNATVSSRVDKDEDDDFRPIPSDIRVDSDTESTTLNVGLTWSIGPVAPYAGVGISTISELGLYRTSSEAFWYEEKDDTEGNLNVGLLFSLTDRFGLDLGANSANEEVVLGLKWKIR